MLELLGFISYVITLYVYIIIAGAVMSWLIAFNVINPHNQFVRSLWQGLNALTEPALRPIRRMLPDLGGIDISPLVLILICFFIQSVVLDQPGEAVRVMSRGAQAWRPSKTGVRVLARVTPKSARDGIDGMMQTPGRAGAQGARSRRRRRRARPTARSRAWWRNGWALPRRA